MNAETFHEALSLLPMDLIIETDALRLHPRRRHWMPRTTAAACAALALISALSLPRVLTCGSAAPKAADSASPAEEMAPQLGGRSEAAEENAADRGKAPILDCTARFAGAFTLDGMTVQPGDAGSGSAAGFSKTFPDIASLDAEAKNIVVGTVTDIVYTDDNASPRTILTFRVSEVLKGDVAENSLISVGQSGGYVRMQTFIDCYGDDHFPDITREEIETTVISHSLLGAPMPEIGDQYVLFLSSRHTEGRLAGAYVIIGNFMGRCVLDRDTGLYDRYRPEDLDFTDGPMTLDEIRNSLK